MNVRDALLEAALKVFGEAGVRGATTRRIAEAARVNEVTLFRHFRTKDELIDAALRHFEMRVGGRALPEQPADPRSELIDWCRAHHRELSRQRALIRKAMSEFEQHPECCRRGMHASVRIARELTDYLERLRSTGLTSGDWDARVVANMLMGAVFADAMSRDTMPERYPYTMRDAIEGYVDLLLAAIDARPGPAPRRARTGV